jgi:hypothetical protein
MLGSCATIVKLQSYPLIRLSGLSGLIQLQSYPIQDEPEGDGMLRIDHPRARSRSTEPGTNRDFSNRQPRDPVRRRNPRADISLDRAGARSAGISPAKAPAAWSVTQLCGEMTGDPVDRTLWEKRIAGARALPASSFCAALYPRRSWCRACPASPPQGGNIKLPVSKDGECGLSIPITDGQNDPIRRCRRDPQREVR